MKKQVKKSNLERVKTLLGNKEIKEDTLQNIVERIKAFCKVSYQLYIKNAQPGKITPIEKRLDSEPPDQFT